MLGGWCISRRQIIATYYGASAFLCLNYGRIGMGLIALAGYSRHAFDLFLRL